MVLGVWNSKMNSTVLGRLHSEFKGENWELDNAGRVSVTMLLV